MMGFVLYSSAVVIPQFAQTQLGYTATDAGLVLAPGAVALIILIPHRRAHPEGRADQICDRRRRSRAQRLALIFSTNLDSRISISTIL